jgi:hypothetical protein
MLEKLLLSVVIFVAWRSGLHINTGGSRMLEAGCIIRR